MKCPVLLIFCLIYMPLSEHIPVSDESSESSESSLTFTWTAPLHLQVRNKHGEMDEIQLRPANSIGSFQVDCLFDGYLLNDEEGSVAVSGCQDWPEVTITIVSSYSRGSMFIFIPGNQTTQEVRFSTSLFTQEPDIDSKVNNKVRPKRSIVPIDQKYRDMFYEVSANAQPMPEALVFNFKLAYDHSFFIKMDSNETAAKEYISRVTRLSQPYFTKKNLGVKLSLDVQEEIEHLKNKIFTPEIALADQEKIDTKIPLGVFVFTNDNDTNAGVTKRIGAACTNGYYLNKWRCAKEKAVITNVHELGHMLGIVHDQVEDRKYNPYSRKHNKIELITSDTNCTMTGVMTDLEDPSKNKEYYETLPRGWSECSTNRFKMFYIKKRKKCKSLKEGIPREPSPPNCDVNNCLDTENCQGGQCEDACSGISCDGSEVCLAEEHNATCVSCIEDQHCDQSEKCDCSNNICVDACSHHSCSGSEVCLADEHNATCVRCIQDQHCNQNEKCDASNNNCVENVGNTQKNDSATEPKAPGESATTQNDSATEPEAPGESATIQNGMCTGSFQEYSSQSGNRKARPEPQTKCVGICHYEAGRWGSSWCDVFDQGSVNWGAECVPCEESDESPDIHQQERLDE